MKTNQEIQAEARQLMVQGNQFLNEHRSSHVNTPTRALVNLSSEVPEPRYKHQVEAAILGGSLVFRLMSREPGMLGVDGSEKDSDPLILASSKSAFDVLRAGYELTEQDRLDVALEQFPDVNDSADDQAVREVEEIVHVDQLSPADRLRTKAETIEFLEGRMERGSFIARVIERQFSRGEDTRQRQVERHELKLTVGEP